MSKIKKLYVTQLGETVLRKKARLVSNIQDLEVQNLIDDLIATCEESSGVGIAAPQVGEDIQVFILWFQSSARYPKAPNMKPTAIINPKIISKSKEKEKDWEGCLSIPGIRGLVPRHTWIDVEYFDRKGKKIKQKIKQKFVSRIFQHEYDHLQGIVFLDRTSSKDLVTEKEYLKLMKKASKK